MSDDDDDHGDNGGDASPDVYLEYVRLQTLDEVAKQTIMGRMRARTKQAKDDGIDVDADAIVKKLAKLDPDTRAARMQNASKQASWRGLTGFNPGVDPDAEQADIWPEPSPEIKQGHRDATIYSDGANTRRANGERTDNPQMAGSRDFQTWDQAWLDTDHDMTATPAVAQPASTERKSRVKKADAPAESAGAAETASVH